MTNDAPPPKKPTQRREKQMKYLSQAVQLEEAVNPHIVRATMTMISLALLVFIVWAGLTNINEIARASGEVVPYGYQQTVQHLEGGIVRTIHIHEGQIVSAGDPLVTLGDSALRKDMERLRLKEADLQMQAERLRAFIDDREPDFSRWADAPSDMIADQQSFFDGMRLSREKESKVIQEQLQERTQNILSLTDDLATARTNLEIAENMLNRRRQLNAKGYATDMQLLQDEREINDLKGTIARLENQVLVAETQAAEYQNRLESLAAGQKDESLQRLSQVTAELSQNTKLIQKLEEQMDRLSIRAPANGIIKGLSVNTIGAVIAPGQKLMEIIPLDERLEIAVKIAPQDVGHVSIGQPVQVKFSSYDFSRYGTVSGTLAHISAMTFKSEDGSRHYQGRIVLDRDYVGDDPANVIIPGMTVMADIITGRKTILEYMLKPIHASLKTAFTER